MGILLLGPLLLLLLIGYIGEIRTARSVSRTTGELLWSPIARATMLFILLLSVPWLFVHRSGLAGVFDGEREVLLGSSITLSALISYTWYRYLTWLDTFERERRRFELLVFLLACVIAWKVPMAYTWLYEHHGFDLTGSAWNDWWYSMLAIGGIEETAKLLPLLAIWRLTRQVNEPYDFMLYGSISALGFAFVENIGYLYESELRAVMGRALMSSVMHMMMTGIIAYGLAIAVHRQGRLMLVRLLALLLLASAAHGFYDFWLLAPGRPRILTVLFFILSLQLWVTMKNNLINLSPHFTHGTRPVSAMFRYRLINGVLFVLATAYCAVFLLEGTDKADQLLMAQSGIMTALLLLIALNFSSFAPIPGYVAPLRLPSGILRLFVPRVEWERDLTGARVELKANAGLPLLKRWTGLMAELPVDGLIERRLVVDDETDWYQLRLDRPLMLHGHPHERVLMQVHQDHDTLPNDRHVMVRIVALPEASNGQQAHWNKHDLQLLGHPLARMIAPTGAQAAHPRKP